MVTIGFRAIAIIFLLNAILPLRSALADQHQGAEEELVLVAETALIAEIFGDDQEEKEWSAVLPRFALEIRPHSGAASEDCE